MQKLLPIFLLFYSVSSMAQMNGSYTVGGSSPDYGNIQQAIDALMINGVDGPATILIRDGNYPMQLNFGFIPGVSAINRVTFQSENQDSSLVEISYAAAGFSDNWVVQFDSTQYVTLKWLTLKATGNNTSSTTVVDYKSHSDYTHVENCFIEGKIYHSSALIYAAQGSYYNNVHIKNNHFYLGGSGINMRNDGGSSFPNGENVVVENNFFEDNMYGAITMINHDFFEVKNNKVLSHLNLSGGYDAFYFSNGRNGGLVANNHIVMTGSEGITVKHCRNNTTNMGYVYNNFVSVTGDNGVGLSLNGQFTSGSSWTKYWNVYNNTVITNCTSTGISLNVNFSSDNNVYNNIFYNHNIGVAINNYNNTTIANNTIDYNVFYSVDSVVASWDGVNYLNFASFQTASTSNTNSFVTNPNFDSITDFHLCNSLIDNAGSNLFYAYSDLDGELRDTINPDIGADEFDSSLDNTIYGVEFFLTANQANAEYQWLDCDNNYAIIPTETFQTFDGESNGDGNYAVQITMGNCVDTSACYSIIGVGINEVNNDLVSVYPNPTSGILTVDLGQKGELVNYMVTTIDGRVVEDSKTSMSKLNLDLTNESKGVYFLRVTKAKSNKTYKIIRR